MGQLGGVVFFQHQRQVVGHILIGLEVFGHVEVGQVGDAQRLTELKPQEQRYWRLLAERKGAQDARMLEFRWLLEELRVSFFAQELRTPQPVSIKRLEKAWGQLNH
jgi:hypothetical protein